MRFIMLKPFKNLRIRELITQAVLAWYLLKSLKYASLNQKQNNSVVHERVIENQFNTLDDSHISNKIIQTETATILAFRQKTYDSSSNEVLSKHDLLSNETEEATLDNSGGAIKPYVNQSASQEIVMNAKQNNGVILVAFKNLPKIFAGRERRLDAKKRYVETDGVCILLNSVPVQPDTDSTVPVESRMGEC